MVLYLVNFGLYSKGSIEVEFIENYFLIRNNLMRFRLQIQPGRESE